ncbi:MAG: glycerophosphodiester phosphodiesterase [Alphaproteobacteria bacterium]|nr:glycerophosphodiester phosphodiesterase [Alphaproteobacteria bacterium]
MSAPAGEAAPRFRPRTDVPRLIAHRGLSAAAPENTIAAFEAAEAAGFAWVEFDVMLSGDGVPVVIHDETLGRTTDGRGKVAETPLATLKTLDAGRWFAPQLAGQRIPTLEEALAALDRLGLGANVEIKPARGHEAETGAATARLLAERWPARLAPPVVSSFSPTALKAAHAAHPAHDYAPLFERIPKDWAARMQALSAQALHCSAKRLSEAQAREVTATGAAIRCYTVNDRAMAERLFGWGVESLFADDRPT